MDYLNWRPFRRFQGYFELIFLKSLQFCQTVTWPIYCSFTAKHDFFPKFKIAIFFWCVLILECCRTLTFHRANEFELERVMIRFPGLKMNSLKGKWKKKSNYFSRLKEEEEGARIRHSEVWVNIYGQIPEIVVNL